jgi:hypothetical protein
MATLSSETAALIASTEKPAKLPSIYLVLTVEREKDSSGKPILHRFICSTDLNGRHIEETAGNPFTAHKNLQKRIHRIGYEPMWSAVHEMTALDDVEEEPEEVAEEVPTVQDSEIIEETVEEDVGNPVGEHEDPAFGLVVTIPVLDESGWLTPLSDQLSYHRVYLAAWELATGMSVYSFNTLDYQQSGNIRAAVGAVMMSGDAGARVGIPAKAVNPWAPGTDGTQQMSWIRVNKLPDPTTKPYRHKEENPQAWRERRASRNYVGVRGVSTVAAKDRRDEKRNQAHAAGQAAKTAAITANHSVEIAEIHYKWVYAATFRALGEIHAEYERQLEATGISIEQIIATSEQMKAA